MLLLIAVALFTAVALLVYSLMERAEEQSVVRASLRQLGDYQVENVRDRELLKPVGERVVSPVLKAFTEVGRRFTPQGYTERTRQKLQITGKSSRDDLDRFLATRVLTIAAIPVVFVLFFYILPLHGLTKPAACLLIILVLVLGPDAQVNRAVEARQAVIRKALPDILDLLVISVEAGLGFEQALDRTVKSVPGPLSEEFVRMLNEVRAGSTRAEAMRGIEARTNVAEVRSFVMAILQADTFGVSIGRILRAQADEMRVRRRQEAQERAMKAPVKMLFPMILCIFPALFVVTLGPAAINIGHTLK